MSDLISDWHNWKWVRHSGPAEFGPQGCPACEIERLRDELDDATKWNHSVRVCKDHTADIVDGECVICELAEKIEHIEELEQALAKASLRTQELEEVARAVTLMVGHSVNAHYAKVTGG